MFPGIIATITGLLSELAAEPVVGVAQGESIVELARLRSGLDAEIARRIVAFDNSCDWAADGAQSAAG